MVARTGIKCRNQLRSSYKTIRKCQQARVGGPALFNLPWHLVPCLPAGPPRHRPLTWGRITVPHPAPQQAVPASCKYSGRPYISDYTAIASLARQKHSCHKVFPRRCAYTMKRSLRRVKATCLRSHPNPFQQQRPNLGASRHQDPVIQAIKRTASDQLQAREVPPDGADITETPMCIHKPCVMCASLASKYATARRCLVLWYTRGSTAAWGPLTYR